MAEKLADILAHSKNIDDLTDLKYAVFDEDCAGGEALDALGKLFVKVAAAGRSTTLDQQDILELKAVEVIIWSLQRKRDVRTLFTLACAARIPGRPTDLSERCIQAALKTEDHQRLYDLATDKLDDCANMPEPVRTACQTASASAITSLARAGFSGAFQTSAFLFAEGEGVTRDLVAARVWYQTAASVCGMEAAERLKALACAYNNLLEIQANPPAQVDQFWRHMASVALDSARRIKVLFPGNEIASLIEGGEDDFEYVEFKSTLRWCTTENCKRPALEDELIRSLAGLLNAKGGSLFIGIAPDRSTVGIEKDWSTFSRKEDRNKDGFDRHLRQVLEAKLGSLLLLPVRIDYQPLHDHQVCRIVAAPSPRPILIGKGQGSKFFVRSGRQTRDLKEPERSVYIKGRWPDFAA